MSIGIEVKVWAALGVLALVLPVTFPA